MQETLFERSVPGRALPTDLIAVYNDGGGNLFCVRVDEGPGRRRDAVLAWWHDDDSPPEQVDESFAAWLRSLVRDE